MENDKGFSLIEVIASIVILSIVLLSFFQIFIQTNKTAVSNNEKLVVINLADAELERLKLDPSLAKDALVKQSHPKQTVEKKVELNDKDYIVSIRASQDADEQKIKLINVLVQVVAEKSKTKSSVEGYVSNE